MVESAGVIDMEHPHAATARTINAQLGAGPREPSARPIVDLATPTFTASSRWLRPACARADRRIAPASFRASTSGVLSMTPANREPAVDGLHPTLPCARDRPTTRGLWIPLGGPGTCGVSRPPPPAPGKSLRRLGDCSQKSEQWPESFLREGVLGVALAAESESPCGTCSHNCEQFPSLRER
jgi:hypothetical protein